MGEFLVFMRYRLLFRPVRESDLEQLRQWRNQPEVRFNMLNTTQITPEGQRAWYSGLARQPWQRHLVAEYRQRPVGSANLKAPSGHALERAPRLECGLYLGDAEYRGTFLAFCLALGILDHAFEDLGCGTVTAVVLEHNRPALRFNQALGYREGGRTDGLVHLVLEPAAYLAARSGLLRFVR